MKITHLALVVLLVTLTLSACGQKPLLENVSVAPDTITPNADGQTDLTKITFLLNRNAIVSITLFDAGGQAYIFRAAKPLSLNEDPYTVYFGGIVDGFVTPGAEEHDFTITKRMLPDGVYTWEIRAEAEDGEVATATGTLTIQDADTQPPGIRGFSVAPKIFSPNQDGIDDRVRINLTLDKDVEDLRVYLQGQDGVMHAIPEDEKVTKPNAKGWHTYDYDGGIDAGSEPPPDGLYTVFAEARDAMGQRVIVSDTLEIVNAGLPKAYIVNATVEYNVTTMVLSDTLCFTLTVENDSATYIRTTGPWPGTTYRSDQNFNTLGWSEESGAFRIGMDFDTSLRNYPFRWGIGQPDVDLVQIGNHWYLPPHARSQVSACVQVVEMPVRNPLYYWMGLIHEDVEIAAVNNRVDPNFVTIWEP
ncbi:MAG TPA: hypothetical protein PKZ84_05190 [Anaerolineae bacterium]|nr:hypothetical protein [Anaerolineae bacterium]HQI83754.1 hypothetical protein [Anaerolineae bacterium]